MNAHLSAPVSKYHCIVLLGQFINSFRADRQVGSQTSIVSVQIVDYSYKYPSSKMLDMETPLEKGITLGTGCFLENDSMFLLS